MTSRPLPPPLRAAIAAVAAAGLLAACSGKGDKPASAGPSVGAAGWAAATATVKVGLIAPLTGPFAVLGQSQQNSLQVEIDRINAAGGVGGARLELVPRDSGLDPAKAVQAAQELASDPSVRLVVGPSLTAFWDASKKTFENAKKLNCQPGVAGGSFADQKYAFRAQDSYAADARANLAWLQKQGVTSIALVYEQDDTGKSLDAALKNLAPTFGIRYQGPEFTRPDDPSHLAHINAVKGAGALWISSNVPGGPKSLAAAHEAGYPGKIVSGSGLQNIGFLEAGGGAADGAVFADMYYPFPGRTDPSTWQPGYRDHIRAVVDRFGRNTGQRAIGATSPKGVGMAADCVFAYARAADDAKSVDPEKVATAWAVLQVPADKTPSGNTIAVGPDHELYRPEDVRLYQWTKDAQGWYAADVTDKK
ncbi:branched-chain amino acid ABC transporter substrate-binding protein [Yinghuangia aomiensis]|uniref:Branched-chain amino acid ABC transporter substrate-binding protein n=1 Tax=Yinghuangia aomiensis TaxID=676205 RepID=A0ABP9I3Z9_9ACTN